MLQRDDELRLSDAVQKRYAEQQDSWDWKWQVTEDVQKQVCREFGFQGNKVEEGLDLLRSACAIFPGDKGVREAAHYLRYNIHVACPLVVGTVVPNLPLFDLNGGERLLSQVVATKDASATVIFADSHT